MLSLHSNWNPNQNLMTISYLIYWEAIRFYSVLTLSFNILSSMRSPSIKVPTLALVQEYHSHGYTKNYWKQVSILIQKKFCHGQ